MNVKELWRTSDAVCFDVDSTVCIGEGIDDFANFCGVGKEVAEWTNRAMNEESSFREALTARLNIIKPTKSKLEEFIKTNQQTLTPGVKELINRLKELKRDIYLISGGFLSLIRPVALELGIPEANIFANKIMFNKDGTYAGFDKNQPTSSSGGKPVIIQQLKYSSNYKTIVMIGDGMTDLETYPPADLFIGFGGNCVREKVRQNAPWYVYSFQELIDELK